MVLAEDLRQAVLQAALQGKLTEQLETDSDVDEFIVQIKRTKKELVDAKEIKREANISDVSEDETPCNIPNNWRFERLGNLFYIERGASPRPISVYITTANDGVNWVKIGDTEVGGKYVNFTKEKITKEGAEKSRAVKVGDFIFSNSMSFGRPYIMNVDGCIHDGWNVIHNIHSVDNAMKEFNQDYLYFVLSSTMLKQQIIDKAEGGVVKNIRSDNLRDLVMPVPPIEEQKRIVDKINEIMPKIDEYEKIEKELEVLKKEFPINMKDALLQAAMQGKLTEQLESDSSVDELLASIQKEKEELIAQKKIKKEKPLPDIKEEEIPFDIPENWKWVRLNEIGEIVGGGTPKTSQTEFWDNGDISWITPADMNGCGRYIKRGEKSITQLGLDSSSAKVFPKGSVVISSRAPIGYIAIAQNEASTSQGCKTFSAYIRELILSEYIYYAIQFRVPDMEKRATGTTFKEISGKGVGETIIPLPPVEEQQRIVERLDALLPLCEALKEE